MPYRIAIGVACLVVGVVLIGNGLTAKEGEFRYGEEGQDGPMPVRVGRVLYTSVGILLLLFGLLLMVGQLVGRPQKPHPGKG